jgi:hypothetical protein
VTVEADGIPVGHPYFFTKFDGKSVLHIYFNRNDFNGFFSLSVPLLVAAMRQYDWQQLHHTWKIGHHIFKFKYASLTPLLERFDELTNI